MPEAKRKELKESAEQSGFVMVNKKRDSSGRVRVSGGQSLRESAEYTDEFANFICSKFAEEDTTDHPILDLPARLDAVHPAAAPFDWSYAQLGPIRAFLQKEIDEGRFVPTLNLPL